ncbi:hypothetical protein CPAV1605_1020 [seawater metagenome]|uniref:Myb-like domain-containing protein n=1 Tax=seawater metagenome TaxID=1561972 RepID=A0A5E8CM19_9ZZZZ
MVMLHESKVSKIKSINISCDSVEEYELFLKAIKIDGAFFISNAKLNLVSIFYEKDRNVNLRDWTLEQHRALEYALKNHAKEMYETKEERWKSIIKEIDGKNSKECLDHFKYVREHVLKIKEKENEIIDIQESIFRFDYMPINFHKMIVLHDCINGNFKNPKEEFILIIYKFDILLFSFELTPEETYQRLKSIIDKYENIEMHNVYFASSDLRCCFNLLSFAEYYQNKFNLSPQELENNLWGDNYYTPKEGWSNENKKIERAFNNLIIKPLIKLYGAISLKDDDKINNMLKTLNIKVDDKYDFNHVINQWFPLQDILIRDFINI